MIETLNRDKNSNIVHGIDISSYQDGIETKKLLDDEVQFVICRGTYGSVVDKCIEKFCYQLAAAQIPLGMYSFVLQDQPLKPQIDQFVKMWKKVGVAKVPVCDIEHVSNPHFMDPDDKFTNTKFVTQWCNGVADEIGVKPLIYTNPYFLRQLLIAEQLKQFDFWISQYPSKKNIPPDHVLSLPDVNVVMWQWIGNDGRIVGYDKPIDRNVMTRQNFDRLFG